MNETGALRFLLPSGNQILETILFADVVVALCAAMVDDIDESRGWLLMVSGFCGIIVVRAAVKRFQWVSIDGATVRVVTTVGLFRARQFDAVDVASVTYETSEAGTRHHLLVELKPSASRSWVCVKIDGGRREQRVGVDAPLFVAFMAAVWRIQPGVKVRRLPADYAGALQAECLPSSRADVAAVRSALPPKRRDKSTRRSAKKQDQAKGHADANV